MERKIKNLTILSTNGPDETLFFASLKNAPKTFTRFQVRLHYKTKWTRWDARSSLARIAPKTFTRFQVRSGITSFCKEGRIRTHGLRVANAALYQLSYRPIIVVEIDKFILLIL